MAEENEHDKKVREHQALERTKREVENSATSKTNSEEGGIWGAIVKFLEFVWDLFFGNKQAPQESGVVEPPETTEEKIRYGRLLLEKRAIPKWEEYQRKNGQQSVSFISPVAARTVVTSGFGHRDKPTEGASTDHAGVDLAVPGNNATPDILASAGGIVLFSGRKQGYGNTVVIGHADGRFTLYAHMSDSKMPTVGDEVKQGQVIGVMGRSGTATNVHLHYEQRRGTMVYEPEIQGTKLTRGITLDGDKVITPPISSFVSPDKMPRFPVTNGNHPPVAFAPGAKVSHGAARVPG